MGENETASPDWAWAILDRVITTSSKGFAETHTLAIADSRDPREGDYLTPPAQLQHFQGMPVTGRLLREWGWDELGPITMVDTEVLEPVETRLFGQIPPYRGAFRVRRNGVGTPKGAADPVPYGPELAAAFSDDDPETEGPRWNIGDALLALEETGFEGLDDCADAHRRHMAGEELSAEDLARSHAFLARNTLEDFAQWFVGQIRVHGFPRAGVDPVDVCYLATAQSTLHPDPDFRRECLARARERAATGDIDPEYMALIESASRS